MNWRINALSIRLKCLKFIKVGPWLFTLPSFTKISCRSAATPMCWDPESFARGGPNLKPVVFIHLFILLMGEERSKIPLKAADDGPTLNAGLVAL